MDAKFINPVLHSMVNVLSTMAHLQPRPGKLIIKNNNIAQGVVTGLIALEGDLAHGSIAISFPKQVILDITKRMLQEDKNEIDATVMDLTGELANMVLGGAKGLLDAEGYNFGLTLPSVLSGENHIIDHPYPGKKIVLPFGSDSGEFYVEICFAA